MYILLLLLLLLLYICVSGFVMLAKMQNFKATVIEVSNWGSDVWSPPSASPHGPSQSPQTIHVWV